MNPTQFKKNFGMDEVPYNILYEEIEDDLPQGHSKNGKSLTKHGMLKMTVEIWWTLPGFTKFMGFRNIQKRNQNFRGQGGLSYAP